MHMRVCVINGTSTKVLTDEIETFMGGRRDSFLQLQRQYHAVLVVGWIYLPNHNKKVAPPTRAQTGKKLSDSFIESTKVFS